MKIAFLIDTLLRAGGGNSATIAEYKLVRKIVDKDMDIKFITTSKETKNFLEKKFNDNIVYFNKKSLLNQIFLLLSQSEFFKILIKKIKIKNTFEKLLNKLDLDLLIFLAPSDLIFLVNNNNFVYTVWEFQHKNYPFFPEYKNVYFDINVRDKTLKLAADKAFNIIVGTEKSKKDFIKYYSCDENKITIRPLKSSIVSTDIKDDYEFDVIKKLKNKKMDKYLFYPAQYWAHKNHKFIIDAFDQMTEENISNLTCVFAGSDKGNLNYIKELINFKNLNDKICIFEYLSDEEIVSLYKNCYAVVVPTLVGTISFPILEGFFFQKPVICGTDNLDENFKKYVINLDLQNPKTLEKILVDMQSNPQEIRSLVSNSKFFFDEMYDDEKLTVELVKIIKKYYQFNQMWKH